MPAAELVKTLLSWLPYTAQVAIRHGGSTDPELSALLQHPKLEELAANANVKAVLGAARMLSKDSDLPDDHMFTALLKTGLVDDMLFLHDAQQNRSHLVIALGGDVCGHAKIVHGGLLSAICDETFGALVYCMKMAKALGPEPAVTANLNINYRKPVPTRSCLICTAQVTKLEGRKIFLEASVKDVDSDTLYVEASTLFINLKTAKVETAPKEGGAAAAAPKGPDMGSTDLTQWSEAPRYQQLCSEIGL